MLVRDKKHHFLTIVMRQVLPMTSMIILFNKIDKIRVFIEGELEGIVNGEESHLSENKLNE